jgi:hypothetical protein
MSWKRFTNQGPSNDLVGLPFQLGNNTLFGLLNTGYYHAHGTPFVYPDNSNSIQLTSGAGAWNQGGALVEVIPAGAMAAAFDLHWINIANISANSEIQIDIFAGAAGSETRIGATRSQRNAVQSRENANRIQIAQQPAGTRISCRLNNSEAAAITANVSFEGHYYV